MASSFLPSEQSQPWNIDLVIGASFLRPQASLSIIMAEGPWLVSETSNYFVIYPCQKFCEQEQFHHWNLNLH